jgi:hypothetical protein
MEHILLNILGDGKFHRHIFRPREREKDGTPENVLLITHFSNALHSLNVDIGFPFGENSFSPTWTAKHKSPYSLPDKDSDQLELFRFPFSLHLNNKSGLVSS